jgi:cell surface protein SprA
LSSLQSLLNPDAYEKFANDPSADDYRYFKDAYYAEKQAGIIERYMNYNGMEKNSHISTGSSTTYGTSQPDVEDINGDFTLSENESYFQYKVHLQKKNMEVGQVLLPI